jgi:Transport and Golgi organisation 2
MCTVIVRVPDDPRHPTRVLAVRDEDPEREWNPLGDWWPEAHPGVIGVRDVRAGGAWLAAAPDRGLLAVLLNRAEGHDLPESAVVSRGALPLAAVEGEAVPAAPRTRGFNLLTVGAAASVVTRWDGTAVHETVLGPGTHMVAHDDVDDPATGRIAAWLPAFAAAPLSATGDRAWWEDWFDVLAASTGDGASSDAAIVRDNRYLGIPTQSLLVCVAEVTTDAVDVRYAELPAPGVWAHVHPA